VNASWFKYFAVPIVTVVVSVVGSLAAGAISTLDQVREHELKLQALETKLEKHLSNHESQFAAINASMSEFQREVQSALSSIQRDLGELVGAYKARIDREGR
jgi:uncharacterized protein YlxW (UPF0749 family)